VALVFVGSIILPALYLFTPGLGFADYRLPAFVPGAGSDNDHRALAVLGALMSILALLVNHA